ncbi:MAG TPA: uracil-DNA glycosylase family protein [Anaerolineae bacterium]|nr:uracil-DNA glycosylase family protein [Anaerolineae bacterium]
MEAWEKLQAEMRACRLCLEAGHDIVPGAVFAGSAGARVMLIGQAPGVTEVEAKRPFNASSGRRLFKWLGAAGWQEDDFRGRHYMTAVTKCFPGKAAGGKGDRVPSKKEQKLCRPFLEREIKLVSPEVMILVGGLAIKLLYPRKWKLTQIIGTAVYWSDEQLAEGKLFAWKKGKLMDHYRPDWRGGRWVVPLPHPSGASLWPNKESNKQLIRRAVSMLSEMREEMTL